MQSRSLLFFFTLISLHTFSFAQQRVVDQLRPVLDTLPTSIEKVDMLLDLARAYGYCGNTKEEYKTLKEVREMSNQIGYKKGIGQALIFQNIIEFNEGKIEESLRTMEEAMAIAEEIGSKDFQLICDYNLAEWYISGKGDYEKALAIVQKGLEVAGDEVSKKNLASAYRSIGACYTFMGDSAQALLSFKHALELFNAKDKTIGIDSGQGKASTPTRDNGAMSIAQTHDDISLFYERFGQLDSALDHSMAALKIYEAWDAPYFRGGTLSDIGYLFYLQGKLDESLKYLRKAKDDFILTGNKHAEAQTNSIIGIVYIQVGELEEALKIKKEALHFFIEVNDSMGMMENYGHLGKIELKLNHLELAESYSRSAFQIAQALGDSSNIGLHAGSIGSIVSQKGDYESGLEYLQLSYSVMQSAGWEAYLPQILLDISKLYERMEKPDSAIHYAHLALGHAARSKMTPHLKNCHEVLSKLYEETGDFEKALGHHRQYVEYFEELYSENAQQRMKEEQVRQNVELYEKEKSAAEANAALLAQRNQLYTALVATFLGLFLLSGYLALRLRRSKKEIESQNQRLVDLNKTKDKFFGIIAHDIRSPMVALQSVGQQMGFYLKKERFDKVESLAKLVAQTTQQLDALLDNLLNWALLQRGVMPFHPKPVSLNEAVSEVTGLFAGSLEAKGLNLKKDIPTGLEIQADERALQTTLRNLMSNAIKFTPDGGTVSISSEMENGKVKIKVKDTGTGIEKSVLDKLFSLERKNTKGTAGERGTGLGLILCKELVEMNKGKLSVFSEVGKGSAFEFSLPKN